MPRRAKVFDSRVLKTFAPRRRTLFCERPVGTIRRHLSQILRNPFVTAIATAHTPRYDLEFRSRSTRAFRPADIGIESPPGNNRHELSGTLLWPSMFDLHRSAQCQFRHDD